MNRTSGVHTFKGHVTVDQGSTHLTGDTVIIHNDAQKKVSEIIAIGSKKTLAHYQTQPNPKQAVFDAWAVTIKYHPKKGLADLIQSAKAKQNPNVFTGPHLIYDVKQGIVSSPASTQGHVTIIMYPNHLPQTG